MGERLQHRILGASALALAVGVALSGCGASPGDGAPPPSSSSPASAGASIAPTEDDGTSASPDPSAGGDWWPEQQKTMATGQEFPADYEPATLDHPARNVPKPVMPEEASQETEAGAQAFLNYRTDAVWYAFQTGNTSFVREVTSSACEKCEEEFQRIESIYSSGGWLAGGYEKDTLFKGALIKDTSGIYSAPVQVKSSGVKAMDRDRLRSEQQPFDTADGFNVNLDFEDEKWIYITSSLRGY